MDTAAHCALLLVVVSRVPITPSLLTTTLSHHAHTILTPPLPRPRPAHCPPLASVSSRISRVELGQLHTCRYLVSGY